MGNTAEKLRPNTSTQRRIAENLKLIADPENTVRTPVWERLLFSNPQISLAVGALAIVCCLTMLGVLLLKQPQVKPPSNTPEPASIIPPGAYGVVYFQGKRFVAGGAAARLIEPQFLDVWAGRSKEPQKLIEVLLYKNSLSPAEINSLVNQSPLNPTSDGTELFNPLMAIQIPYTLAATTCDSGMASNGAVLVKSSTSNTTPYHARQISPAQMKSSGLLTVACTSLSSLSQLNIASKNSFGASVSLQSLGWDFSLSQKPIQMQPTRTIHIKSFTEAYALVEPNENRLSIGFFTNSLSDADRAAIGVKGALNAGSVSPNAIMSMELDRTDGAIDRRNIVNDCSLVLTPPAKELRGLSQKSFMIESAGSGMKMLAGNLKSGSSVALGISGRELFTDKYGMIEIVWALQGEAKLIYRGTGLPAKK